MVVATPGRLLALSESGNLPLDRVIYLVVDESDRFMQGSMEEEIRKVSISYISSCFAIHYDKVYVGV